MREIYFSTSSMRRTGAEIHSTAFHSCQFNGVIWNKDCVRVKVCVSIGMMVKTVSTQNSH